MKISKEKLLTIKDLRLSDKLDKMDDKQFEEYCKALDRFIESYPAQELELKKFLKAKDHTSYIKILLAIEDELLKIHADDLAKNCPKLINDIKTARYEVVEAFLTYFLTAASALSIDIQMAQFKGYSSNETDAKGVSTGADGESAEEIGEKSILAVDDVSLILSGLKSVLQKTPYKFTGVTSATAALRFIKSHKPDLFILDIEMPEMNGYDLAKKIKDSGQTAPVIFLTGNATREYVLKAIEVGAVDFIVKPINKEQVLEKIIKYIGV